MSNLSNKYISAVYSHPNPHAPAGLKAAPSDIYIYIAYAYSCTQRCTGVLAWSKYCLCCMFQGSAEAYVHLVTHGGCRLEACLPLFALHCIWGFRGCRNKPKDRSIISIITALSTSCRAIHKDPHGCTHLYVHIEVIQCLFVRHAEFPALATFKTLCMPMPI